MKAAQHYNLSLAAQKAGLSSHQVRNYLQFGLVKSCAQSAAGHHRFDHDCIERMQFIGTAMRVGVLIDELRVFLQAVDSGDIVAARSQAKKLHDQVSARRSTINRLSRELKYACQRPEFFCTKLQQPIHRTTSA